jgi:hypothetical protein
MGIPARVMTGRKCRNGDGVELIGNGARLRWTNGGGSVLSVKERKSDRIRFGEK